MDSYEIRNTLREGKSVTDYTDVPANAWYYKAADYVTKNGLLSGDKAYTFGASKALTAHRSHRRCTIWQASPRPS